MRRPSRRTSAVIAAATCLLAGGVITGASAIAPTATSPSPAGASGQRPKPPPGTGWTLNGIVIDTTQQAVKKAKIVFSLPKLTTLAYTKAVLEQPIDPKFVWDDSTTVAYVTSPKGSAQKFGFFPVATVHMLAFGTVPVTARVHITQIRQGKKIVPLNVTDRFTARTVKPPHPLPCKNSCQLSDVPHLTGPVDVRIDQLQIDKVPVDVGLDCHTGTPATLSLVANRGYFSISPPFIQKGVYVPFVGGTLHGPVDVPAFTGCHNGGDVLDPLVTGMVSGPGNELTIHTGPLTSYPPPKG